MQQVVSKDRNGRKFAEPHHLCSHPKAANLQQGFWGKKQKVKPSKPSANQPKNKTLPEVKVDCIKHGKASVESKSMSMQDVDATLKRIDKDYFSGGSNAEDVPDTEEDVEAGIHIVPSKVGEVPVD